MSLLLEALKKAEKAKEDAQRRARGDDGEAGDAPRDEAGRKPVLTRDKLPEISTSLEIVSDDLSPPPAPASTAGPALEPLEPPPAPKARPAPKAPPRPAAAKPSDDPAAASRASAKKVFEAKFSEPNPRMPFYIAMGTLGAFALGTVGYFWYQLRPPASLVNLNPARQAEAVAVAADAKSPAPAAAAPSVPNAIPGLPATATKAPSSAPSTAPAAAAPGAAPRAPLEAPVETPRLRPAQRVPDPRVAPPAASETTASVSRAPAQVHPRVEAGYAAYLAGDLAAARSEYQQAVREETTNRDALLGLAALDVRAGRYESAEALYLRVLQVDPRDAQAQAALIALRSGRSDPLATESRVKTLLAADPSAHALNFALGNQLAQQNRWAEAQQEYFKAYTAEPDNADFAYNLAVSLDHLRQPRQALDYYQRAIGLSEKRGASFDLTAARLRATELTR
jgi:tetratricopeptide (TPR) repeat protein